MASALRTEAGMRSVLLPLAGKGRKSKKLGLFAGIRRFMILGSKHRGLHCGPSVISSAVSLTGKQTKGSVTREQACMASIPVRWMAVFQGQGRWMQLAQQGTHVLTGISSGAIFIWCSESPTPPSAPSVSPSPSTGTGWPEQLEQSPLGLAC